MLGDPFGNSVRERLLEKFKARYGIEPNWALYHPRDTGPDRVPLNLDRGFAFPPDLRADDVGSAEDIIARRKEQFARKDKFEKASHLIPVRVSIDGPFAVTFFGDPHVDDDGTDLELLEGHVRIVKSTKGMFGACVGDIQNNWTGRLAHLYGQQSTSAAESWKLVEWFVNEIPWLFLVGGNHDMWSGAGDPLMWMTRQVGVRYQGNGVRIGLNPPSKREIRVNCRHDFQGHSQFNAAHAPQKAAQMGWRDHILICGHRHIAGYGPVVDPATGLISHAIRVGTYKRYDAFAKTKGFPDGNFAPAMTCIVDPEATRETQLVTTHFDVEEAAEFLTYKRKKRKV